MMPQQKCNNSISVLVLTYNQQDCIVEALSSIVSQSLPPSEIVLSDDCSSDSTFDIASNYLSVASSSGLYSGCINLRRNERNLGFIAHFNQAVSQCAGHLIVYNAGDDISCPERFELIYQEFLNRNCPKHFLAHSQVEVNGGGQDGLVWIPPIEQSKFTIIRLANSCALHIGASQAFTKSLFDDFGPIRFSEAYEDLVLGFRALLTDSYVYIPKPLLRYRVGGLTNWQKNDWDKKRGRYEAVLSQRALDAIKWGRLDLLDEISKSYQDYGFCGRAHPRKVTIYCVLPEQESVIDYSILDHVPKFEWLFDLRPVTEVISLEHNSDLVTMSNQALVFLRLSNMGWASLLDQLAQLDGVNLKIVIDLGIDSYRVLASDSDGLCIERLFNVVDIDTRIILTSACPQVQQVLANRLPPRVLVPSPHLVDIDGPTRPRLKCGNAKLRFLVCLATNSSAAIGRLVNLLKGTACMFGGTQVKVLALRGVGVEVFTQAIGATQMPLALEACETVRRSEISDLTDIVIVGSGMGDWEAYRPLVNLEWIGIAESVNIYKVTESGDFSKMERDEIGSKRGGLYFSNSIQKRPREFLGLFGEVMNQSALYERIFAL